MKKPGILLVMLAVLVGMVSSVFGAQPEGIENLRSTTHTVNQWSNKRAITFAWDAVANATGYSYVLDENQATEPDGSTEIQDGNATSVTINIVDGEYYFHIRAVGENGELGATAHVGPFKIDTIPPSQVADFSAVGGDGRVTLSWTAPGNADLEKVVIRYREAAGGTCNYPGNENEGTLVTETTTVPGGQASYQHTGLTNGHTYCYAAFACDRAGNCAVAATTSATPAAISITVTDVNPDTEGNTQNALQLTIAGSGFSGTSLAPADFKIGDETVSVTASSVQVESDSQVTAIFDLTRLPAGTYSVCVKGACKSSAFTVTDPVPPTVIMTPACNGTLSQSGSLSVTFTSDEPYARIYYTLNGTDPTAGGQLYNGTIELSSPETYELRYAAYDGANWSSIGNCTIVITSSTGGGGAGAPAGGGESVTEQHGESEEQGSSQEEQGTGEEGVAEEEAGEDNSGGMGLAGHREELREAASDGFLNLEELTQILGVEGGELQPGDLELLFETGAEEVELESFTIAGEAEVPADRKLIGARISGRVHNQGELREVRLASGAEIEGGTVSGEVVGEVEFPEPTEVTRAEEIVNLLPEVREAVVKAEEQAVRLEKVVLRGVRFEFTDPAELNFGEGVVFDQASLSNLAEAAPEPVEITVVLPGVSPVGEALRFDFAPPALQFPILITETGETLSPAGTVEAAVEDLGLEAEVEVDPAFGIMEIRIGEAAAQAVIRKLLVVGGATTFAAEGPEIRVLQDGTWWVRRGELAMVLLPMLHNPRGFDSLLAQLRTEIPELAIEVDGNGFLLGSYFLEGERVHFAMTASGISVPARRTVSETQVELDEEGRVVVLYPDGREEILPPAPVGLSTLGDYLSSLEGVEWRFDRSSGNLVVKMEGQEYPFRPDYTYRPLTDEETAEVEASEGRVVFRPEGDCGLVLTPEGAQRFCPVGE